MSYEDIKAWIDLIFNRNGRKAITGDHANQLGVKLLDYIKNLYDNVIKKDNQSEYTPTANYHPATKKYVDESVPDITSKADKNNVLELDNTTEFTPDGDYEPATKKYVDENSGQGSLKLDQSTKQTLTESPIFGGMTPGRLVIVNTDGSLIDVGELTWDSVNKRLGINKTNPTYKVDIVAAAGETTFLSITGNGVSASQGFARLTNGTGSANIFAPIFWGKSNNAIVPGWDFLADSTLDTGSVPVLRFGARINNGTVVNRPLLDVTNFLTTVLRVLANGNVGLNTITPTKKLHVGGTAGYVSSVDEGTGDTDFASRKTTKTFGKQSLTTKAPVITVWDSSDYRDGQIKTTKAEYYNETALYYEQRFDWNEDFSVKCIEIKDDITGLWVQRNYTWTDGIPSVSETIITTAWTI